MLRKIDKLPTQVGRFEWPIMLYLIVKKEGEYAMKFGDKLYRLRKKEGLSQGELGDKLNVSRQTVSKWELGQTIPESDKLIEISKLFNVSLDELTNAESIQNKSVEKASDVDEQRPRIWLLVLLIVIALAIVVVLINKIVIDNKSNSKSGSSGGIFNISDKSNEYDKERFNFQFEARRGSIYGSSVTYLLDEIISNNKMNSEHIISVTYKGTTTSDSEEIKNLKSNFDESLKYDVSYEYADDGYVNSMSIEKSDISVSDFNRSIEFRIGTKYGSNIPYLLDDIIMSNTKNEKHIITVIYGETSTSDVTEIRNLKKSFDTWTEYEVWLEYDEAGYVNKVHIDR